MYSCKSLPTQEGIFRANSTEFEDTNLEIFFSEYLVLRDLLNKRKV